MTTKPLVLVTGITGFVSSHVAHQLLAAGYNIRGTTRSIGKAEQVYNSLLPKGADRNQLELFEIDLLDSAERWNEAVKGCTYIQHVASPTPNKKTSDYITPALDGTLKILNAAMSEKTVKRVVLTSSVSALCGGRSGEMDVYSNGVKVSSGHVFDESDWSDPDKSDAYSKSKHLAEKAAWKFLEDNNHPFELATIIPGFIVGPLLLPFPGNSSALSETLLRNLSPAVPHNVSLQYVDVRDVAFCHMKAIEVAEAAGKRHITICGYSFLGDYVKLISKEFTPQGYHPPTMSIPKFLLQIGSYFDPMLGSVLDFYDRRARFDTTGTEQRLGVKWRPWEQAVLDMTYSLIDLGIIHKTAEYTPRR
ncbi:hypothetical protein HK098_001367 [Nowakowskiella sp. JEL0407]|nr:hypothetical protein HK098_001367 [Nowakowskiella sp. JEL0407]